MDSQENQVAVPESHVFVPPTEDPTILQTSENDLVPLPPVDPATIDPKIRSNVECRKAALELIEYGALEPEFKECMERPRFWETLKELADKHLGKFPPPKPRKPKVVEPPPPPPEPKVVPEKVKPLPDDQVDEFLSDTLPQGKYVDKTFRWVLKNDPDYLKEFATKLLPLQRRAERYLARKDKLTAKKKAPKRPKTRSKPIASKKKKAR